MLGTKTRHFWLDRQHCSAKDSIRSCGALRVGVIGCGGTGSAVVSLLTRLGVGHLALMDNDTIDTTNLNRVHGPRAADVPAKLAKVDILAREIEVQACGLGNHVVTRREIHRCVTFCGLAMCFSAVPMTTQGRLTLNRLAHYYGIPHRRGIAHAVGQKRVDYDMTGRVTTIRPGNPCLMCLGVVSACAASGSRRSAAAQ